MMDLKNILSELHRIEKLIEGWSQKKTISTIERDLALDKFKNLYEAVRFAEAVSDLPDSEQEESAPQTTPPLFEPHSDQPLSPTLEEPMVIDFDDMMPLEEEPIREVTDNAEPFEQLPTEEPQYEEPQGEPEPEVEPKHEEPKHEEPKEMVSEEGEAEEPTVAPAIQNSLFDLSEIPVHRRSSRRVLLSLYGESTEAHGTKRKQKSEGHDLHTEQRTDKEAKHPLAEAIREEFTESETLTTQQPEAESPARMNREAEPADSLSESWNEDPIFHETEVKTIPVSSCSPQESTPVLGEVIHADQQTLADTFIPRPTVASSLSTPQGSLKESLALNDRYLLRKELFDDDEKAFHAALDKFDQMPSLDDCMIYITENYTWNANSDAAKMLTELLEHKFGE